MVFSSSSFRVSLLSLILIFVGGCTLSHHQFKTKSVPELVREKGALDCYSESSDLKEVYLFSESECSQIENSESDIGTILRDRLYGDFTFGVVEFDDFGEFYDRSQLVNLKERITEIGKDRPIVFVLFIHGWRHNAGEASSNLRDFRGLIKTLGQKECLDVWTGAGDSVNCKKIEDGEMKPHVVGVYLGWRGDPFSLNYEGTQNKFKDAIRSLQLFSVWNRKRAARFIAGTNATHTILSLMQTLEEGDIFRYDRVKSYGERINFLDSKKYLIGHSFGARFLESAMAQSFLGRKHLVSQLGLNDVISTMQRKLVSADEQRKYLLASFDRLSDDKKELSNELTDSKWEQTKAKKEKEIEEFKQANFLEAKGKFLDGNSGTAKVLSSAYESAIDTAVQLNSDLIKQSKENLKFSDEYLLSSDRADINISFPKFCSKSKINLNKSEQIYCDLVEDVNVFVNQSVGHKNNLFKMIQMKELDVTELKNIREHAKALDNEGNAFYISARDNWRSLTIEFGETYKDTGFLKSALKSIKDLFDPMFKKFLSDEVVIKTPEIETSLNSVIENSDRTVILNKRTKSFEELDAKVKSLTQQDANIGDLVKEYEKFKSRRLLEVREDMQFLDRLASKALFPPADLALMVNPATEALNAQMLINSMCEDKKYRKLVEDFDIPRKPWLMAIKSDGDDATGKWFALVTKLAAYLPTRPGTRKYKINQKTQIYSENVHCKPVRAESQNELISKTSPNIETFKTHDLERWSDKGVFESESSTDLMSGIFNGYKAKLSHISGRKKALFEFKHHGENFALVPRKAQETGDLLNYTDYWNFTVPKKIISDHSDIFQNGFGKLLGGLIRHQSKPLCEPKNIDAGYCDALYDVSKTPKQDYCGLQAMYSCLEFRVETNY